LKAVKDLSLSCLKVCPDLTAQSAPQECPQEDSESVHLSDTPYAPPGKERKRKCNEEKERAILVGCAVLNFFSIVVMTDWTFKGNERRENSSNSMCSFISSNR